MGKGGKGLCERAEISWCTRARVSGALAYVSGISDGAVTRGEMFRTQPHALS